jgi:hypothetical protein
MSTRKSKTITSHFPPAEVVSLRKWKEDEGKGKSKNPKRSDFGLTEADEGHCITDAYGERALGIRKGDQWVYLKADIFNPPDGELCYVATITPYEWYVGFLHCESLTRWYLTCGDWESEYFHPGNIDYLGRIIGAARNGKPITLKVKIRAAHEQITAEIIPFKKRA